MAFARVRYQHDWASPVEDLEVHTDQAGRLFISDNPSRATLTLRGILSLLISRVDSSDGGWCEVLNAAGEIIYRHPAPRQSVPQGTATGKPPARKRRAAAPAASRQAVPIGDSIRGAGA